MITAAATLGALAVTVLAVYVVQLQAERDEMIEEIRRLRRQLRRQRPPAYLPNVPPSHLVTGAQTGPLSVHSSN